MARVLCTIFCRQTLENRDWKRGHEAMSRQILQVDQAMLETTLDRDGQKSVEETLNAMPDASGRPDCRRRQIRAVGRVQGVPGRPLRAGPGRQGRQDEPEGAQAQGRGVLLGGDRPLPAA